MKVRWAMCESKESVVCVMWSVFRILDELMWDEVVVECKCERWDENGVAAVAVLTKLCAL